MNEVKTFFIDHLIEGFCLTSFGLLTFLVRSYFSSIQKALASLGGRFDSLDERSDRHHTEIAVIKNELAAVWRTVDPPRRVSDHLNGGDK